MLNILTRLASKNVNTVNAVDGPTEEGRTVQSAASTIFVVNYLSVSGDFASVVSVVSFTSVALVAEALVVLVSLRPFSNTIKRSGPKISPKNTVFSFDVLRARVVPSGMKGRRQLETGSFWARMV